jgi:hypothetical protein
MGGRMMETFTRTFPAPERVSRRVPGTAFNLYFSPGSNRITIQHFEGAYTAHFDLTAEQAFDLATELREAAMADRNIPK